jgi:ABC-type sugar transport system ATPase subunit
MSGVLQIEALSKNFGGTHALRDADFELKRGEIHALVGENGAGKSTLIRILSGIHQRDSGQIRLDGQAVEVQSPADASGLGMAVIYQDFDLAPNLSIADNLLLGREPTKFLGIIDRKQHRKLAVECLAKAGLAIDPDTLVEQLTVAQRQLVAIAEALSHEARILIMDEPTSALAANDIDRLLNLILSLKEDGTSVLFVSHKLDEVFKMSDRVTVFRDGRSVGTRDIDRTSVQEVASMMVGRDLQDLYDKHCHVQDHLLLEVRGLCRRDDFDRISFAVRKGEVLGLYGLKGAGRTSVAHALFGLESHDAGEILIDGSPVEIDSPEDAIRLGVGFVPEDRKRQALFPNMNVRENLSMSAMQKLSKNGFISRAKENDTVGKHMSRLAIRTQGPNQAITDLSGGNQQKVIISRWLVRHPRLLILDEPTAGVDVGAKSEIYGIVNQLASDGVAILLISSDLPEILGISDRILIIADGRIVGEFSHGEATEEEVMHAIHGARPAAA